ncbi:MAG: hypothetical protein GY941_05770 [Planctomycetes bacterium]|nr:hypothetical protein [Planctomycetota bacterium]
MKMNTGAKVTKGLITLICVLSFSHVLWAGNKELMTVKAAKVISERALIETIYGLKLRATESVVDMVATNFESKTDSKTSARIKGVKYEETIYDKEKDIAKVTASVSMESLANIDGDVMNLQNLVFRRTGFATSTPSMAGPLKALRAAELDAYMQLIKKMLGFTLESHTTVENFMLTSDVVKTKVMATLYLAEVTGFGWNNDSENAYVKMALNIENASAILGATIESSDPILEVEGQGTFVDDLILLTAN